MQRIDGFQRYDGNNTPFEVVMTDNSNKPDHREKVLKLIPGFHCEICSYARCDEFAEALLNKKLSLANVNFCFKKYLVKIESG